MNILIHPHHKIIDGEYHENQADDDGDIVQDKLCPEVAMIQLRLMHLYFRLHLSFQIR
ncbi:hypothetical protein [Macrococcoides caseolyticum]|uniref:hypothetical protein n=1 Tax=Macrococcoides caseolyticum TaxID=69966 RepID=UPI0012FF4ACB|nr:hypothetical protein [Macrococcus caseolyticus]